MSIFFSQHELNERSVSAGINRPKSEVSQAFHEEDDDDMEEVPLGDVRNAASVDPNFIPPLNLKREHSDTKQCAESDSQSEVPEEDSGGEEDEDEEQFLSDWSRSPSPSA